MKRQQTFTFAKDAQGETRAEQPELFLSHGAYVRRVVPLTT